MRPLYRRDLKLNRACTYGFKLGRSTRDVTSVLINLTRHVYIWGESPAISAQDIQTALDSMKQSSMQTALTRGGLSANTLRALMREVSNFKASITIPGCGSGPEFDMESGGHQGGIQTPDIWNNLLEVILEPLIKIWDLFGYGYRLSSTIVILHLIWADNILVLSSSYQLLGKIIQMLTDRIEQQGLTWKAKSLEFMGCGKFIGIQHDLGIATDGGSSLLTYKQMRNMENLGTKITDKAESAVILDYRMLKAEKNYRVHQRCLRSTRNLGPRIRAWNRAPAKSATFEVGLASVTRTMLLKQLRWERHLLRNMLRFKWTHSNEGRMRFRQRTSNRIHNWFKTYQINYVHQQNLGSGR